MKKFVVCGWSLMIMAFSAVSASSQDRWVSSLKSQPWLAQVARVELLKSTKEDVALILGEAEYFDESFLGRDIIKYYNIAAGRVTVTYTTSECTVGERKVPAGVVEEISLSPSGKITFSGLELPKSVFKKTKEEDTPIEVYINRKHGIEIAVLGGIINSVTFSVPEGIKIKCNKD